MSVDEAEVTGQEAVSRGIETIIIFSGRHILPLGISCPLSKRLRGLWD